MYQLSLDALIWRFNLLMASVIIPFYIGYPIFALIALPIFLSALYGLRFKHARKSIRMFIRKEKAVSAVTE